MFDNSCFDFLQVSIFDSSELITNITPIFSVAKVIESVNAIIGGVSSIT